MPSAPSESIRSTVRGVSYFLAHVPSLVRYGSKPSREIAKDNGSLAQILNHLWTFEEAVAYPPNPEGQESIKKVVDQYGADNLVVIIGAPDADSAELYAETVTHGDPTYAGPLAGVALGLPVFHVMEPEIRAQFDPACYVEHLALLEIALDVDKIAQGLNRVRQKGVATS